MANESGRTWRTWQLAVAAVIALVIGAAAGASGASGDREAREEAERKLAAAQMLNDDLSVKANAERAALDAIRRTTLAPTLATTTVPRTTVAPTTVAPTTTTTPGPKTEFGAGTHRVGIDIAPGTYVAPGGTACYWERQSVFGGGGTDSIIANEFAPNQGQVVVTIAASDKGVQDQRMRYVGEGLNA